jgi:hypothetical protein
MQLVMVRNWWREDSLNNPGATNLCGVLGSFAARRSAGASRSASSASSTTLDRMVFREVPAEP